MFLPRFCSLILFAALLVGCDADEPARPPRLEIAQVVAGAGDVDDELLERVRDEVAVQAAALRDVFVDLEVVPFFVHVHGRRDAMPAALAAGVHEQAPGFAQLGAHQVHLVMDVLWRSGASLRGVVRHELVHELLDQYCGKNGRYLPRWFHEGLAQLLAGDTYLGASEDDLVWRVTGGSLRSVDRLAARFPATTVQLRTAYAQSYSYVAWLAREHGLPALLRVARYTDARTSFSRALVAQTGRSTLALEDAWRAYLVHGSGATLRSLFSNWFSVLLILALPLLVLALMRRLQSEERAARRLAQRAAQDRRAAEEREAARLRSEQEPARPERFGQDVEPPPG
ncbi:MAG: peptidase MA family metallohydrolase [Planctomycetota bacterium]